MTQCGNIAFLAAIKDKRLIYLAKNSMTYAHLIHKLFVRLSVSHASKDIFKDFEILFEFSLCFVHQFIGHCLIPFNPWNDVEIGKRRKRLIVSKSKTD